jgi:hypothetical protein
MHLMYTLNDQGNRVYTLKVHISFPAVAMIEVDVINRSALESHWCGKNYQVGSSRCAILRLQLFALLNRDLMNLWE